MPPQTFPTYPQYPPTMGAVGVAAPNDSQATLSLVLGIIGAFCCPVLGPVALFLGNSSRRRIEAMGGALGGYGMATAGFVLGIVGTGFLGICIILVIYFVIAAAAQGITG
ncbi:MAG: DUF4190 domain-containing protein [Candidatus Dormibacteraeota bacterium]|nr:DUF4190 domain-containing protein [Candidatus Dormibacteraeota bacterium]